MYLPYYVIFIKKWQKTKIAIFSTGHSSWEVVEELQRAVAANPEEVAVGTDANIDQYALSYNHAKFGAFVRSV